MNKKWNEKSKFEKIVEKFPGLDSVMIGRGAIRNPALFREIKGGAPLNTKELLEFSKALAQSYNDHLDSSVFTLHKMIFSDRQIHQRKQFPSIQ